LLDSAEGIGCLGALKVPVIAFAAFIVVPYLADAGPTIEQRILKAVP
jgi:hypothetical protein